MPTPPRYYDLHHLHYLTTSTYRRARVFDSDRFKFNFAQTLRRLRSEAGFRMIGYVLMPAHCHVLIWPSQLADPSQIMQSLKERTAKFILKNLHQNAESPWCARMLKRLELRASVHHHAHYRVWQRRFYDMNVWSEKKVLEKLNYMQNNPVKRGLVAEPGDWPWSSWRFYHPGDCSILSMERDAMRGSKLERKNRIHHTNDVGRHPTRRRSNSPS